MSERASPAVGTVRPPPARAPLLALAGAVVAVLGAVAGRYGPHRDELYFLRAGAQPAWGYVDQPPLTPLLAHALDALGGGSLLVLRLPSALMAGLVVLLTGLIARELGGARGAQVLAAGCMAVSAVLLAVGHLLSTTTVDLLVWTALSWLLVRALRDGGPVWLAVGLVAGVGLENKWQPAFLLAALLVAVLVVGPRSALRSPWPWAAGVLAAGLWAPNLTWQAGHGWPQLAVSASIAAGGSGTSASWYVFLPYQLVLISPLLCPVWLIGLWRLARDHRLRTWRAFALAWALLAVVFTVTGGKPYYLAGLFPLLLAAGAPPVLAWVARGLARRRLLGAALGLSLVIDALLMLPVLPVTMLAHTPVPAVNYDAGETVGWPRFAATVAEVRAGIADPHVVVLARNYGEAGAVDHYLPALRPAYSGHNSYWTWGPPPADVTTIIAVGYPQQQLRAWFGHVELAARVDDGVGLRNDEQGKPVWIARDRHAPWTTIWPQLRRYG